MSVMKVALFVWEDVSLRIAIEGTNIHLKMDGWNPMEY